ncbi:MAG: UDP-N-acetylmuramate dehydrogenase [Sandaracinaceae bacterium]|nr:UDP-N-acetylmuramate dehydrogenase [Sandaracinaceae bacterium]
MRIQEHVPLAPRTSLELGGPARFFVEATDDTMVAEALAWAARRGVPARVLGGGSNLVVADAGFDGLVIEMAQRDLQIDGNRVRAAAGEPWDVLVARCVDAGLAGLECLSGIPGRVGATPIQNVGAYGQEVAETIRAVRALDRATGHEQLLTPAQCAFGYRDSMFKRDPDRFVVLEVTFELVAGGAPALRYAELARAFEGDASPSLSEVREKVIALRRTKSMVIDASDPNRRSAGSFFTNPIVAPEVADAVVAASEAPVPRWPTEDGRVKLAAGWLIEQAGMSKGTRRGAVGISSAHALGLVHHGGGTTAQLLALADEVRDAVRARFGVTLEREPVLWA